MKNNRASQAKQDTVCKDLIKTAKKCIKKYKTEKDNKWLTITQLQKYYNEFKIIYNDVSRKNFNFDEINIKLRIYILISKVKYDKEKDEELDSFYKDFKRHTESIWNKKEKSKWNEQINWLESLIAVSKSYL